MNNTMNDTMEDTTKKTRQMTVHISFPKEKQYLYTLLQQEAEKSEMKISTVVTKALKFYFDYQ